MSLLKLRLSMLGTLALIIGVSTLFFAVILSLIGSFNLVALISMVVFFNIVQWLIAPYIIDSIYRVREVKETENPRLHAMVEKLSRKMGIKKPRLMIADIPIPNAFAYGSPIAGNRVAVTKGLLQELEEEEVEAVIGHEFGHIKHRDVQVMMFASVLPAIFYYIALSFMWSGMYRGRDRDQGGAVLIGMAAMLVYWILTFLVLGLSRLREYYADRESAMNVEDGARKLSEALAKIVSSTSRIKLARGMMGGTTGFSGFKTLFIEDPDASVNEQVALSRMMRVSSDQKLVEDLLKRKLTFMDRIVELFSTHPNIVKRLRALQNL